MIEPLQEELRQKGSVRFYVRARPGAATTKVLEQMEDGSLKIAVAAPPEGGKANVALIKYLAKEFSVPVGNVEIVSGQTARVKLVQIRQ